MKTSLTETAVNANQRMREVTCYCSGVSMWNQLKCWVQNAIEQTFYLIFVACIIRRSRNNQHNCTILHHCFIQFMNKAVVQICALCLLFLLHLIYYYQPAPTLGVEFLNVPRLTSSQRFLWHRLYRQWLPVTLTSCLPSVEQQIVSATGLWNFSLLAISSIVLFLSRLISFFIV
jgi:hypothetical protein